jgi:hypothetical protein
VITIFLFQRAITTLFYRSITKPATKKIRFSQFFLFVLPVGAETGEIDEIHKPIRFEIAQNLWAGPG